VAVAELRVQPLAGFADKAAQRVPADLARVGAARALPGADRPVVLDVGRIQIERHRLPIEQRMHAREQLVERPVELTDMTEAEAAQKASQRRRLGQPVTAQKLLRRVGPQQRHVVEALTAGDQRLAQAQDRLRRRVAAAALLHRHPVEQLSNPEPSGQLAHQDEPGVRCQLLRRRRHLDQRRPLCYLHLQECLPVARRDVSQHPIVSGREDVPFRATPELPQDPGSY
jgi:hypothetical protein